MKPLAEQLRPKKIEEFVGQEQLLGAGKPLRQAIEQGQVFSFILWGPPGVGKTTIARIYAAAIEADFHELSAVSAGKDEIRKIIQHQQRSIGDIFNNAKPTVLFLDEIHRFNKAQQDFMLPFVENGSMVLIGATTENPSFEVIPALLSRMRVFVLESLRDGDLAQILRQTQLKIPKKAERYIIEYAHGDARSMLTLLDSTQQLYGSITLENIQSASQNTIRYDKDGEEHYTVISAFIKSMRAGQVDAALYYLARMVAAGEDPKFIARRMVVFASEDIGLAQPTALVVANAVFEAVLKIGLPEAQINLAHGVAYLTQSKKDRSSYDAYFAAKADAEQYGALAVPLKLRNAPTQLMKNLDYGKGYEKYDTESYLPDKIKRKKYFNGKQ